MRLIEPLGLLRGKAARDALEAGSARPLAGGELAFCACRLLGGGEDERPRPVGAIPGSWRGELARLNAALPHWAGMADGSRPAVMAILNVTPDSFSDGGAHADAPAAVAAGLRMAEAGADLVDVGGESTRPGAAPVPVEIEQSRVLPVIRGLARSGVRVSVDTRNAATMEAALDAGAEVVNDVSGLLHDPAAAGIIAARGCPVVLMHMRGDPRTMAAAARYGDVAVETTRELAERCEHATRAGIKPSNIIVDPGIGFAKTPRHNVELLTRLPLLFNLGCRIVAGVSRKSFIGRLSGVDVPARRQAGSLAAALYAVERGASVLRVHDVGESVIAFRVWFGCVH